MPLIASPVNSTFCPVQDIAVHREKQSRTLDAIPRASLLDIEHGWPTSRTLLRRVRSLTAATHRLAAGDYSTRLEARMRDELDQLARDFNQLAQALDNN